MNRELALELYEAAVAAAAPGELTARAVDGLSIGRASRVWLFAFGKAAQPMAAAAVTSLLRGLHAIIGGVVVSPDGGPAPYPTIVSMRGDYPVPGRNSFAAAAKIAEVTPGRRGNDVALVLVSAGASSLIAGGIRGLNDPDVTSLYELLANSGLDIASMNAVRKRFSRWGAGRLALALAPAATRSFAISDVANDDLGIIGSGPCAPDETTVKDITDILQRSGLLGKIPAAQRDYLVGITRGANPETPNSRHPAFAHVSSRVIGNTKTAVEGAAVAAKKAGLETTFVEERLSGDATRAGEAIAQTLLASRADNGAERCVIWGGEATVNLPALVNRATTSGRCQELALAASRVLFEAGERANGITLLAACTGGRDGTTDAAGAIIDNKTWPAIAVAGRDPGQALSRHESNGALRAVGAAIEQRNTGTNVNDVVVGLIQ
jgi:hydroxypyruvate reductase